MSQLTDHIRDFIESYPIDLFLTRQWEITVQNEEIRQIDFGYLKMKDYYKTKNRNLDFYSQNKSFFDSVLEPLITRYKKFRLTCCVDTDGNMTMTADNLISGRIELSFHESFNAQLNSIQSQFPEIFISSDHLVFKSTKYRNRVLEFNIKYGDTLDMSSTISPEVREHNNAYFDRLRNMSQAIEHLETRLQTEENGKITEIYVKGVHHISNLSRV